MNKNNIILLPIVLSNLSYLNIGQPVYLIDRTDKEYGILTGFDDKYIYCHFNNGNNSLMLTPNKNLFLVEINKPKDKINLNQVEITSNYNRVRYAEGLISQLPKDHDGRNTWLLNYGIKEEAVKLRKDKNLIFIKETESCELVKK